MGIVTTSTTRRRTAVATTAGVVLSLMAVTSTNAFGAADTAAGTATVEAVVAAGDASTTTLVYGYDLENDPENCINFLPRPNCGRAPQQAGDRGGALQFALFGIVLAALGTIGTVVVRNVVRRDRALAERRIDD